ncbi:hypothetical protein KSS87_005077 [Heliosperma pusillum]|nr:hypothetical protein KSS87_005077 [Heliosperma pusillum]
MTSKMVAVVGCGAAGLVAAHELRKERHEVVVFERGTQLGGTWVYTPETEPDSLGLDPTRSIVHSSLYKSLRTNIPRELMGFRDFPFVASGLPDRDSRRYPKHEEVLKYLEDFACEFRLNDLIRYQSEVLFVGPEIEGKWKVKSRRNNKDELDETYDNVVLSNGHFTEPRIADIPGIEVWPGWQCHSHNYRTPEPYRDQVVVLIGGSVSAADICQDIMVVAKEVHVACRSERGRNFMQKHGFDNVFVHPMIDSLHEDGRVVFEDDTDVIADVILHCTGYKYHYPFLHTSCAVNVEDNRVGPLYKHVFPPALAPGISFIGLLSQVIPFLYFELQSKWIAGVLSGRLSLPSEEQMMQDVDAFYSQLEATNVPKRDTHKLYFEFGLADWLANQCGYPPIEKWRKDAVNVAFNDFLTRPSQGKLNPEPIRGGLRAGYDITGPQTGWLGAGNEQPCKNGKYPILSTPNCYAFHSVVVLIGGSISALDICKDITEAAKEVHVACRSESGRNFIKKLGFDNVFLHPMIDRVHEDGRVTFQDDTDVVADTILHCTGYKFHYPFLHTGGTVNVDDNRVGPLYKHVFPPALAPGISFIGIPSYVMPFLHFELQSKWIAGVLSGRLSLPSEEHMMQDINDFYSKLEANNVPKRDTHKLDFGFGMEDWLASQCGCPPIEKWRKDTFNAAYNDLLARPSTFRDD